MTHILAVDDSPSMREMIRIALSAAGFTVTEVADGQQALDLARRDRFDLVLSDVHMPNLDGIALIRAFL